MQLGLHPAAQRAHVCAARFRFFENRGIDPAHTGGGEKMRIYAALVTVALEKHAHILGYDTEYRRFHPQFPYGFGGIDPFTRCLQMQLTVGIGLTRFQ